ncbi:hypothetical protein BaRGS_00030992 [Batillaria attramentaria]|uniref:Uncharacterized protein n=1 Tax=Batillaria attramentaria TaxID=370345 RepID=A0ABD0JT10_9CAEN
MVNDVCYLKYPAFSANLPLLMAGLTAGLLQQRHESRVAIRRNNRELYIAPLDVLTVATRNNDSDVYVTSPETMTVINVDYFASARYSDHDSSAGIWDVIRKND